MSIALLVWALYSAVDKLTRSCGFNYNVDDDAKKLSNT
jgi:hypothetical protein